jgi:hypothetical protein
MQENACVRRSVLRGEFHGYAFMVGFGSVRDVRIRMVPRNEPLHPLGTLVTYRVDGMFSYVDPKKNQGPTHRVVNLAVP